MRVVEVATLALVALVAPEAGAGWLQLDVAALGAGAVCAREMCSECMLSDFNPALKSF